MSRPLAALLCGLLLALPNSSVAAVTFDWAYVGNAGNAADPSTGRGSVNYGFAISRTEVTNAEYAEFLNTVAADDAFGGVDPTLYNNLMGSASLGGITRSGSPGTYSYSVRPNMANKPVAYVSFFDAMRFVNWLHNGQVNGGTESGVYEIGTGVDEVRSENARFWIPSEDEWYKAAYHQPATQGGDTDDYWLYPTASNAAPTLATANLVGDITNPGANVANYDSASPWNGLVTTVASAGPESSSFYGTFDQAGNLSEWNEPVLDSVLRGFRGGNWASNSIGLRSDNRVGGLPAFENSVIGFRIATIPEPTTATLLILGVMGATVRRRC